MYYCVWWRTPDDVRFGKLIGRADYCHTSVLTAPEIEGLRRRPPDLEVLRVTPMDDPGLKGKYWVCKVPGQMGVHSTDEVLKLLSGGEPVSVLSGPHDSESQATYKLDVMWEAPGGD